MKLALLEKWHREVSIFLLVSTPDRVGAIQTRHHQVGKGGDMKRPPFFAVWWVLSEYNGFDHFSYSLLIEIIVNNTAVSVYRQGL